MFTGIEKEMIQKYERYFWAYPDAVKLLNIFPIWLVIPNTYKINKYRQPLFKLLA